LSDPAAFYKQYRTEQDAIIDTFNQPAQEYMRSLIESGYSADKAYKKTRQVIGETMKKRLHTLDESIGKQNVNFALKLLQKEKGAKAKY